MPNYRYYQDPEPIESSLGMAIGGGFRKGFESGIDRTMEAKLERQVAERKRKQKLEDEQKADATELSNKWMARDEKRKYDEKQQALDREYEENLWKKRHPDKTVSQTLEGNLKEAKEWQSIRSNWLKGLPGTVNLAIGTGSQEPAVLQAEQQLKYYDDKINNLTDVPEFVAPPPQPEEPGYFSNYGQDLKDVGGAVGGFVGDVGRKAMGALRSEAPVEFLSIEEAEAAGLPPGTKITINGRPAIIE